MKKFEELSQKATQAVTVLASSLAEVEDNLEEMQRLLQNKMGGDDDTGNKPIIRLKEAIQTLKHEINDMIINIGIQNNELLSRHKEKMNHNIQMRNEKLKKSSKNRFNKKGGDNDNDGYVSS